MEIKKSVCPYDCPDCCGLLVSVDHERAVRVTGDPAHSFTRGTLCPKMAHYERTVHSPLRLTTPLKRTGPKGSGQFTPITWDEAIKTISTQWKTIIHEHGAEAILPYSYAGTMGTIQYSAGHSFFYALGASSLDRTICAPAKSRGYRDVMGGTLPTAPQEAQHSDLILIWSISMLATDIHFKHDLDLARKNGARIWCIDTYETPTARYADEFTCVRPGTDGALALGLMHIIARDGLTDDSFITRYVQGWDELRDTILSRYTPEYTSQLTGVPTAVLEQLAQAYAAARAPFIRLGSGQSRYGNGAMTSRLITCLPAITGAFQHAGGGLLTSTSGSHAFDKNIIRHPEWEKTDIRHINMIKLGEVLNNVQLTPAVKSLYVYSSNPACTAPDQQQVLRGLAREDLFTVVHERFLTDTARYADIILPATTSLEHDDIYYSYGHYTIQRGNAVIPPVGESKSNWQVFQLLAEAMGLDDPFFRQSEQELIQQLIASTESAWPLPVPQEKLAVGEPVDLPLPDDYKLSFGTPSGRIEIFNPRITPALPDYFPAHASNDAEQFYFINSPDPRILDSSFNERPELTKERLMTLLMHPLDARQLGLQNGDAVVAENARGQAAFTLELSEHTHRGCVVSEGIWWQSHIGRHNTNALTWQRTTDKDGGSTFYDLKVNIRHQ